MAGKTTRRLLTLRTVADIAIVAFILLGAVIGFRKGFIVPVLAAGGALLTMSAVYAGPLTNALPSGNFGLGASAVAIGLGATVFARVGGTAVGVVHRLGILRKFDHVLGSPLGAVTTVITLYVALLATLVLDGWLDPLHGKKEIGPQEIAAIQTLAKANPTLAVFADPATLEALAQSARTVPVSSDQLAQVDAALGFYENTVRPELLRSRIAPVILKVGEKLPLIGRPAALPTR